MLKEYIQTYKQNLQKILNTHNNDVKNTNEHTFRTPFENFLNNIKDLQDFKQEIKENKTIKIIQEPKTQKGEGSIRPDFKVFKQVDSKDKLSYNALQGFIECKKLNADLNKYIQSEQIKKYLETTPNILLTNYNRFILIFFRAARKKGKENSL